MRAVISAGFSSGLLASTSSRVDGLNSDDWNEKAFEARAPWTSLNTRLVQAGCDLRRPAGPVLARGSGHAPKAGKRRVDTNDQRMPL